MTNHPQVQLTSPQGITLTVDKATASTVNQLWSLGVAVETACQGDDWTPARLVCLGSEAIMDVAQEVKANYAPYVGVKPSIADFTGRTPTPPMANRFGIQYALGHDHKVRVIFAMPSSGLDGFLHFLEGLRQS